jgi:hypothetical protein
MESGFIDQRFLDLGTYRDSNSEPSVIHPVASRYAHCATAMKLLKQL